jgi:hypothetical protein
MDASSWSALSFWEAVPDSGFSPIEFGNVAIVDSQGDFHPGQKPPWAWPRGLYVFSGGQSLVLSRAIGSATSASTELVAFDWDQRDRRYLMANADGRSFSHVTDVCDASRFAIEGVGGTNKQRLSLLSVPSTSADAGDRGRPIWRLGADADGRFICTSTEADALTFDVTDNEIPTIDTSLCIPRSRS